jgi:hypothetical protein
MPLKNTDVMKFLAVWEMVHEMADEGMKASIARGESTTKGDMADDPGAFVDGLAAIIDKKKDAIKAELIAGEDSELNKDESATAQAVAEMRYEVAELRGRMESMSATIDAIAAKL